MKRPSGSWPRPWNPWWTASSSTAPTGKGSTSPPRKGPGASGPLGPGSPSSWASWRRPCPRRKGPSWRPRRRGPWPSSPPRPATTTEALGRGFSATTRPWRRRCPSSSTTCPRTPRWTCPRGGGGPGPAPERPRHQGLQRRPQPDRLLPGPPPGVPGLHRPRPHLPRRPGPGGGRGILAAANLAPRAYRALLDHFREGRLAEAQELQKKLFPLGDLLAKGGVPLLKQALRHLGLPAGYPRPPYPAESPLWERFLPVLEGLKEEGWVL